MPLDHDPKLCLACASRRLAGKPDKPCADCVLLNVDPLANVRANSSLPSPLASFNFAGIDGPVGQATKPARATAARRTA